MRHETAFRNLLLPVADRSGVCGDTGHQGDAAGHRPPDYIIGYGPLVVGEDLMMIEVGETVQVHRPDGGKQ